LSIHAAKGNCRKAWAIHGRARHVGASVGKLQFYHYDLELQALAKLERGHSQDLEDVTNLIRTGNVTTQELRRKFKEVEPNLIRYSAVNIEKFKTNLENFLAHFRREQG
jgi:hypothetical protein